MLASNLTELRERKGLSKAEFARLLDVKYTTYNGYEVENKEPRLDTLVKMADILGVSLDKLLGREKENDIFNEIKNIVEKAGIYIVYNDTEVEIQCSGFYNDDPVNFSKSFPKEEFIKIFINLIDECEKEKDKLLKEKIKLYLFDAVFSQSNK